MKVARVVFTIALGVTLILFGWLVRGHATFYRIKDEYHIGNIMIAIGFVIVALEVIATFIKKSKPKK